MFIPNNDHDKDLLSTWSKLLDSKCLDSLLSSKGYSFYQLIFREINEEIFSVLFSEKYSAPNASINCLVGALILKENRNWSYTELMSAITFNIEIRIALGLKDLGVLPFSRRTLFNFKNRLQVYYDETGINLLEQVFDKLTSSQLKTLKIKTSIQRADSVLVESNIRQYSRLSLLVEVLRRLHVILTKSEQQIYSVWFSAYLKGGESYIYSMKQGDSSSHLEKLAPVYYGLHELLESKYRENETFELFKRVYEEHFKLSDTQATEKILLVRPPEELNSSILQSPDDLEATFRTKRKQKYHGYVIMGAETCHPDNEVDLVTKLVVDSNNVDDAAILVLRLFKQPSKEQKQL